MNYYRKKNNNTSRTRQVLIFIISVLLLYFAFNFGKAKSTGSLDYCNYQIKQTEEKFQKLQNENIEIQKEIEKIKIEKALLDEKYNKTIPSEDALKLFEKINDKVAAGVKISRFDKVVSELKSDRKCSDITEKRFIIKTPLYKGDIDSTNVSFERGKFDITAEGYSFINDNRKPESWFDPNKAVSFNFNNKNGTKVVKEMLPLKLSIILDNKEYFFEITQANQKGFVNISEYSCNYP